MTTTPPTRYIPEVHKSNNPDEVHWFVRDRLNIWIRHGWFMYVENAQAAATKMNKDAATKMNKEARR